jgi:hypothetical protein
LDAMIWWRKSSKPYAEPLLDTSRGRNAYESFYPLASI